MKVSAVLKIEDVGDDKDKAFLMGTVLIRLAEHLRMANRAHPAANPGLRHLTVIEEAHRLLRGPEPAAGTSGAAAHAVEMFAGLLAEIRAYGEGLVIAEQIPGRLAVDVIKNTAVKIVHRLPAADDREVVGATMNMTPAQNRYLVTLRPGEAAVFVDGMDFPMLAQMPDHAARESAPVSGGPADLRVRRLGRWRLRRGRRPRRPRPGSSSRAAPRAVPTAPTGPARSGTPGSPSGRSASTRGSGCGRSCRCSPTWPAGRCRCRRPRCSTSSR